jgi:hypothetical protein
MNTLLLILLLLFYCDHVFGVDGPIATIGWYYSEFHSSTGLGGYVVDSSTTPLFKSIPVCSTINSWPNPVTSMTLPLITSNTLHCWGDLMRKYAVVVGGSISMIFSGVGGISNLDQLIIAGTTEIVIFNGSGATNAIAGTALLQYSKSSSPDPLFPKYWIYDLNLLSSVGLHPIEFATPATGTVYVNVTNCYDDILCNQYLQNGYLNISITTPPPTTPVVTTTIPTTVSPTTMSQTTLQQTTLSPTTIKPTTQQPTTQQPTTASHLTIASSGSTTIVSGLSDTLLIVIIISSLVAFGMITFIIWACLKKDNITQHEMAALIPGVGGFHDI